MLTIRKISVGLGDGDAAKAARYPLEQANSPKAFARGDYYTAEQGAHPDEAPRPTAMWAGSPRALEALGLEAGAEVTSAELEATLQGRHVGTGEQVRRPGSIARDAVDAKGRPRLDAQGRRIRERVPGVTSLDLTFSVPKSVSVLWSQAGPEQRAEIERAVLVSANATLEHMTQTKGVVFRRGADGIRVREPAVGMAAALTLHVTARRAAGEEVPSPQLHVHGMVVGVERADGALASADSFRMFKDDAALEGGAVGRAVLADQLVGMGYRVEAGTGRGERFFEVRGVSKGLMERMSGRTRDVERAVRELEAARGERLRGGALSVVASETRAAKDVEVSPEQVARVWAAQGQEFEFGPAEAAGLRGPGGYRAALADRRELAREEVLRRIRVEGPTVSAGMARAIVYEVAPGRLSAAEAHDLLGDMERAGELISLERGRVTTHEIRRLEEHVMDAWTTAAAREAEALSDRARAAGAAAASKALGEGKALDAEQMEAFQALTSGAGWTTLTGRAGTGKGPTLHAVAEAYRADGWQVIASAVDGTTAQRLGRQIGATSYTIEQVKYRTRTGRLEIDERTLLLIDEASKVGSGDWAEVATWSRRHGAHVLAVGHEGQLGAIELPGLYAEMLRDDAIPTAELREIRRHRDPDDPGKVHPWLRDYQIAVDEGRAREAVEILEREDAITLHDGRLDAMEGMVREWDGWRGAYAPEESVLIVHGSNVDVDQVNVLAQERRIAAGELGRDGVPAVDRDYLLHAGDVVILRERAYDFDRSPSGERPRRVENGQVGIVDEVDVGADRVRVLLRESGEEQRLVEFDLARLRTQRDAGAADLPALRLAYASHTFPVQGATVRGTSALAGHWSQGKEGTYVADSRSVHRHSVHAAREDLGSDGTDADRLDRYARRIATSQARVASIRRRLEPGAPISVPRPLSRPLPDRSPRQAPERAAAEQAPRVRREDVRVADPLEAHRDALGDERTERLRERAERLGRSLPERDEAWLLARREELGSPLEGMDRGGAFETLRNERDQAIVSVRMEATRRELDELTTRAEELDGLRARGERASLEAKARVRSELVASDRAELDRLGVAEQRLRDEGRHLDEWLSANGERAARWAAVERELAIRRELERASDASEHARADEHEAAREHAAGEREEPVARDLDVGPEPPAPPSLER